MKRLLIFSAVAISLIVVAIGAQPRAAEKAKAANAEYKTAIRPLLAKYCFECHGNEKQKGELNLESYADVKAIQRGREKWLKAWQMLHTREMPPKDKKQPTPEERERLAAWVETTINDIDCEGGVKDPGRVVVRRLTRYEYRNTVRDLLGVDFKPASDFPADEVGYGFDNIGDVLSLSPLLMEKYLAAAEAIVNEAVVVPQPPAAQRFRAEDLPGTAGTIRERGWRRLNDNSEVHAVVRIAAKGEYSLRVRAFGEQAGDEPPKLSLEVGREQVSVFDVTEMEEEGAVYETKVALEAGEQRVTLAYINDYYDPDFADRKRRDRNLLIIGLEVVGPQADPDEKTTGPHAAIFGPGGRATGDSTRAGAILEKFASRAYRRPVSRDEVERFVKVFEAAAGQGLVFEEAMKLPLQAVLASPHFLFRVEGLNDPAGGKGPPTVAVNDYELATRLSYFLWSSMPDEGLFGLARAGKLSDEKVLRSQVKRMLADPKAAALAENFATQWLQIRRLYEAVPDPSLFPAFDPKLRDAMYREAVMLFDAVRAEDRPVLDLLNSDYTFVNEPLAKHYGLGGVKGEEMRRVKLDDARRGGVTTLAAVLTVTSNPTRTNPTRRGKWVLETVLGTPPPPPLPDVGQIDTTPGDEKLSLRQRLERHRSDANCAGCHSRMDPIGFGFERFNAVGAWREKDGALTIDDAAVLPDGSAFRGPLELKSLLMKRKDDFARALSERILTYALGRGLEYYDVCVVKQITKPLSKDNYRFSTLVTEIVNSHPFRYRRTAESQLKDLSE